MLSRFVNRSMAGCEFPVGWVLKSFAANFTNSREVVKLAASFWFAYSHPLFFHCHQPDKVLLAKLAK